MFALLFKFLLHRKQSLPEKRRESGFTLIELLVAIIIASFVISGLMYLVVDLLQTNYKESAQTETQRDMQMALDFISSDLREAVYVYGGDCIQGNASQYTPTDPKYCPGIVSADGSVQHVPLPSNSVPVLAFWKLDPLPATLVTQCGQSGQNAVSSNVPCVAGRSYSLVVYFLRKNQPTDQPKWLGKSRIIRYELTQFDSTGNPNLGYVRPDSNGVNFQTWPFQDAQSGGADMQSQKPQLSGTEPVLVDFVDDAPQIADQYVSDTNNNCFKSNTSYVATPTSTSLSTSPFNGVRSFYACVRVSNQQATSVQQGTQQNTAGFNQDVFVFLRGNAYGRTGTASNGSFLPTLQTQVLRRGVFEKTPNAL